MAGKTSKTSKKPVKKAVAKKGAVKRIAVETSTPRRKATKKIAVSRAAAKASTPRKASAKNAVAREAGTRSGASRKAVAKKVAKKRTPASATGPRNTSAKKLVSKTAKAAASRKSAAKKVSGRGAAAKARTEPRKVAAKKNAVRSAVVEPALLSGGNPQIAKGYGDVPIRAYIKAMPSWKSGVGRRLDALIGRTVPGVQKAVKWNSPLYGIEGNGWFLGIHCFTNYIKVAFFRGRLLRPVPPGGSKTQDTRYLDIHENEPLDEAQFIDWVDQASQLPGERM